MLEQRCKIALNAFHNDRISCNSLKKVVVRPNLHYSTFCMQTVSAPTGNVNFIPTRLPWLILGLMVCFTHSSDNLVMIPALYFPNMPSTLIYFFMDL